ncbi:MAG TPA: hypothetical protein VK192_02540 [Sphingomicrobium sp.]|nr:hypothetical protein [Sphingomicrobium sp.]
MLLLAALIAAAIPPADEAAIFGTAGFTRRGGKWRTDCDDPGSSGYEPGAIDTYKDLNGDGRPEAIVTEGGSFCYGITGTGFWLLSKQADGRWATLYHSQGMAELLTTRGVGRMPDISVGGPGFCFPIVRWDGKACVQNRLEYEGKACRPEQ